MKYLVFLLMFIHSATYATVLVVPDSFRVISVNNTPVKQPMFVNETALSFSPGRQVIVLQYADMFDSEIHDDHTKVRSEPFVVSFQLEQQSKLKFVSPKIDDLQQAQQYANAPKIEILDEFGRALELVHSIKSRSQMQPYIANNPVTEAPQVTKDNISQEANPSKAPNSYEMLKFWWLNASEEDKKRFQAYIRTKDG